MIFGGIPTERIQFNEDSLWVGNEHNTGGYQPFGDVIIDVAGMKAKLDRWLADVDAWLPIPNPRYNPDAKLR